MPPAPLWSFLSLAHYRLIPTRAREGGTFVRMGHHTAPVRDSRTIIDMERARSRRSSRSTALPSYPLIATESPSIDGIVTSGAFGGQVRKPDTFLYMHTLKFWCVTHASTPVRRVVLDRR